MDSTNQNILIYSDNLSSIYKTIDHLIAKFANVVVAKSESEYFEQLNDCAFDVVVIDLDVSPMDGIALITESINRIGGNTLPYFVLYSDKDDDFLVELALNNGVDVFTTKIKNPNIIELIIKSLLRRRIIKMNTKNQKSGIKINREGFVIENGNQTYELPKKEFLLLTLLRSEPNKFFSKQELASEIWNNEKIAEKRVIDVHIYNIRKLLGKNIIQSQKGKGYRINKKYFA